jgi:hypothetical protein
MISWRCDGRNNEIVNCLLLRPWDIEYKELADPTRRAADLISKGNTHTHTNTQTHTHTHTTPGTLNTVSDTSLI